MKRAVLYMRVSTLDQHSETQLLDLRQMAAQRGYEIVEEYTDRISGAKARQPGLDAMMADARRGRFDVVLVWASDRIARSVKHFLDVLDELSRLNIEYVSFREQIDTGGPLGRAIVAIIGAVAELERNLIVERVRAGPRRAKLEGWHIGRNSLELDDAAIQRDRCQGTESEADRQGPPNLDSYRSTCAAKAPGAGSLNMANSPCDKRGPKTHPLTSTKQSAESERSGRIKRCGLADRWPRRDQRKMHPLHL